MKHLLFIFLSLIFLDANSQDLIITKSKDSIPCKIIKQKKEHIYFVYQKKDSSFRSTLISMDQIISFEKDFYQEEDKIIPKTAIIGLDDYKRYKVGIHGGLGWLIAPLSNDIPEELVPYSRQLKSGFNYGINASYYFSKNYGVGLVANFFKTKNSFSGHIIYEDDEGYTQYGRISDDINLIFIGPAFYYRFLMPNLKDELFFDISAGYISYKNNKTFIDDFILTSNSLSFDMGAGYDLNIQKNFYLYFYMAYRGGSFGWYDIDNGITNERIDLEGKLESTGRIEIAIGIRFAK